MVFLGRKVWCGIKSTHGILQLTVDMKYSVCMNEPKHLNILFEWKCQIWWGKFNMFSSNQILCTVSPPSINFHLYEVCARGSLSGGCTLADNFNLVRTQGCHCQTCHSSNNLPLYVRSNSHLKTSNLRHTIGIWHHDLITSGMPPSPPVWDSYTQSLQTQLVQT